MTRSVLGLLPSPPDRAAGHNRRALRNAGVLCVNVVGGPGCGKSTLLERTIERLMPLVHVGVVSAESWLPAQRGAGERRSERVVQVSVAGGAPCIEPRQVGEAIAQFDLKWLDLLFVENVGSLTTPAADLDVGQGATVVAFSVAGGDDKARKHADLVDAADAVVLNKVDLVPFVPFDLKAFRQDVRRIKPGAELFEVGALTGQGLEPWLTWLRRQLVKPRERPDDASHWFG